MIKVSDAYSLDDLCEMSEEDMEILLRFYAQDKVPRMDCLRAIKGEDVEALLEPYAPGKVPPAGCPRAREREWDAFDGSFGFCVGFG